MGGEGVGRGMRWVEGRFRGWRVGGRGVLCGGRVSQRINLSGSVSSALKCKSMSVVVSHPNVMEGMVNFLYNVM